MQAITLFYYFLTLQAHLDFGVNFFCCWEIFEIFFGSYLQAFCDAGTRSHIDTGKMATVYFGVAKQVPYNAISTHLYLMKNAWKCTKYSIEVWLEKMSKNRSIWQFTSKFCLFWCIYWEYLNLSSLSLHFFLHFKMHAFMEFTQNKILGH